MPLRIKNSSGVTNDTKIYDAETGEELIGTLHVTGVDISIAPQGDVVRAEITSELVMADVVAGETRFLLLHPFKGGLHHAAKITYADGTEVEFFKDGVKLVKPAGEAS